MANNTLRDTLGALSSGTKAPSSSRSKQRKESQPDSDLQSAIEPLASSRSLGVDPRYKRQHVTRACDSCRRRKIKVCNIRREEDVARSAGPHVCTTDCDSEDPCATCVRLALACRFSIGDKRRIGTRHEQTRLLEERVGDLEASFGVLQHGSDSEARKALSELRAGRLGSSQNPLQMTTAQIFRVEADQNSRRSHFGHPSLAAPADRFTCVQLPPKDMICRCSKYFFDVVSGLLYVGTAEEFDTAYNRIYNEQNYDILDVVDVCAIAAVGTHYLDKIDRVSDDTKDTLYRTVLYHINDVINVSNVRSVRALICMALFGIIEKQQHTRIVILRALHISQWSLQNGGLQGEKSRRSAKLYRTVLFLECWLSTSLGYQPAIVDGEVKLVLELCGSDVDQSIANATQLKVTEIGLLKADILQVVYRPQLPSVEDVDRNMKRLEQWYATLPEYMTLSALMTAGDASPLTTSESGALVLGHALYLGTVILLHHRILVATADSAGTGLLQVPISLYHAGEYCNRCIDAARSISRVFMLLGFTSSDFGLHHRCWLSTFEVFTATTVMLTGLALDIVYHGVKSEVLEQDLERVRKCLLMLKSVGEADHVGARFYRVLAPHYELLSGSIAQHAISPSSTITSQNHELNDFPATHLTETAASMALRDLADILRNPFGHLASTAPALVERNTDASTSDWWDASTWCA